MKDNKPVVQSPDLSGRRPLTSRDTRWASFLASRLAATSITPNQVSFASMVFAAMAGLCFYLSSISNGFVFAVCLVVAGVCCQLRLLCNLLDGMVAIEAGKHSSDGAFWNEFPDRLSDIVVLLGVGLAVSFPALGWAAATFAVLVSYVRELGTGVDDVVDFRGPMAKPQRMALITLAALVGGIFPWLPDSLGNEDGARRLMEVALWLVIAGSALTVFGRCRALLQRIK